jgi:hypothetical protein
LILLCLVLIQRPANAVFDGELMGWGIGEVDGFDAVLSEPGLAGD